ncbi:hypothetical protein BT96DRAFT_916810 [Gymnopus androsaceus JB14]|uniref:Uncharacterized protein n=1 Tax=Gymnopus androsaceus JB14 TaxID=1447944 RepID=A0A6A4I137_9AGAR|nr:hypothetical protein BT96DRAFT_916810 [Gymnopus androsaceus JB14]
MAQYLQSRIEDPIWLEPSDISFLRTSQISELTHAKLVEIASLRNVLAPVRRVPLEILTEIFELVSKDPRWKIVPHMFILSSVCMAWRKAAHATPRLWSTLDISFEVFVLGPEFTWVEDWITRSQTVPLDLYLEFSWECDEFPDVQKQRGKKFLEHILSQFGHKVRLLDVTGRPSSFLPILNLSPSSSLSSLEEMYFSICEDASDDSTGALEDLFPQKAEVFLGAPKLRQVVLNRGYLLELLALPAEQLTSLKVNEEEFHFDTVMFVDILLPRCKQLVSLEIYLPSETFIGLTPKLLILLPALRSLEVYNVYDAAENILRCITAPLLERLSISCHDEIDEIDLDSFLMDMAKFQRRSSTALSSLVFYLASKNRKRNFAEKLIAVLSLFPAIRSLEIHPPWDVNALVQAMTCNHRNHVLPNLRDLVLFGYLNNHDNRNEEDCCLSVSGLKSMVLSRWWPDDSGSKVTLRGFHVSELTGDIAHLSALSGLVLDYYAPHKEYELPGEIPCT